MNYYLQMIIQAAHALIGEGNLNSRLTEVATCLLQIDDRDVPPLAREAFKQVRDPLLVSPMVVSGTMASKDLDEAGARAVAQGVLKLLLAEMAAP